MDDCMDFLNLLEPDMSLKVFSYLEAPSDLVRIGCVSHSWRHFVVASGLCKQLCLRMFPQLNSIASAVELNNTETTDPAEVGSSNSIEWETLEREHRIFALLARGVTSFVAYDCILEAISASCTDDYPRESIHNTLDERERFAHRSSYWSSKGQNNPVVPETLIYKLVSDFCVVTEIDIQPFQAFFQDGSPIYSAKSVRFRMGHPKSLLDFGSDSMGESCHDDKFSWTYTSPIFEMIQENRLQKFKLPENVLCIGGFLQVELLGRVQRQDMDGLFYICVCHVKVKGRSLSPAFSVEVLEPSGKFVLKNNLQAKGNFQQIGNMLRENIDDEEYETGEEDDSDEEFYI